VNQRKITDVIGNGPGWTWSTSPKTCKETNGSQARGSGLESDAAKMPRNIFRYVLETSGLHQLFLLLLTVGVFLLEVVPLELRRRIVNDLVKHRDYRLVIVLCAVYAGAVLVQGGTKLVLNVYRSRVGERATRDLRRRVRLLVSSPCSASSGSEAQGIQASMIVAEVEPIGGFVGASVSEPLLQGGVLLSVLAYMVHVDLWMGGTALALFVPQLVFVLLMQGAINRRTGARSYAGSASASSRRPAATMRGTRPPTGASTACSSSTWESFGSSSR